MPQMTLFDMALGLRVIMFASRKLLMGLVWLLLAGCIFFWEWTHPESPGLKIWDTNISIAWVAVLLSLYNIVWWWVARVNQKRQRALEHAEAERRSELRKRARPPQEWNPSLDFTDQQSKEDPKSP